MTTLTLFLYLQLLDLLTTQLATLHGIPEANPFVAWMMHAAATPTLGLLGVKVIAVGYAVFCWATKRLHYLAFCNWWFALVPVWNLVVLIVRGVR